MVSYYGHRVAPGAGDTDTGQMVPGASEQRAQIMDAMTEHGWGYAVGLWSGKPTSGSPSPTLINGVWAVASAAPTTRLGFTSSISVSNVMGSATQGQNNEANLITPVMLWSGVKYAPGGNAQGGTLNFGMHAYQTPGNPSWPDDYYFHYKNTGTGTPSNPFAASGSSFEGGMNAYIAYDPNVAPTITSGTMAPAGVIATTNPSFGGDFTDGNTGRGDKLNQFQIQVRQVGTTTNKWDSTQSATGSEQTAGRFGTSGYGGSAITAGLNYEWRYRVSDQFGVWSGWSSWVGFSVNGGGSVSVAAGTPTGKQETQTPSPFTGVWSHVSALSTNAIEVRVKSGATIVRTMAASFASTVANGGTLSVTWAQTGFSNLSWAQNLTYEMRARDTGGLWSAWSAGRAFTTNASPTVPSGMSPSGGVTTSAPPKLSLTSTDIDDTTGTGFAVSARIKTAAGVVIQTRAMTYNATTLKWEYQTIVGVNEVQALTKSSGTITGGTFTLAMATTAVGAGGTSAAINWNDPAATVQTKLEAVASIGVGNVLVGGGLINSAPLTFSFRGALAGVDVPQMTVVSSLTGTTPVVAMSTTTAGVVNDLPTYASYKWDAQATDGTITTAFSAEQSFIYGLGPIVTLNAPLDGAVLTTSTPTITIQQDSTQVSYRVYVNQVDASTGALTLVHDSLAVVQAASAGVPFNYVIPAGVLKNNGQYQLYATSTNNVALTGTSLPISFSLVYTASAGPANLIISPKLVGNDVTPSAIQLDWDEPPISTDVFVDTVVTRRIAGSRVSSATVLARLTSVSQSTFVDGRPVSGVPYTYQVYFEITQGTDTVASAAIEASVSVTLDHIVINTVTDYNVRAGLRFGEPFTFDYDPDVTEALVWGQTAPHAYMGDGDQRTFSGKFELQNDRYSTGANDLADMLAVRASRDIVCVRSQYGDIIFGWLAFKQTRGQRGAVASIETKVRETDYVEGEAS